MKKNLLKIKYSLVIVSIILLSACGGGSTDSGGVENNVTSCIASETGTNSLGLVETTLTNTCDFTVILGRGIASVSTTVTLAPGAIDRALLVGGFIACRPPSQPFDQDDSAARDFACTG